MSFVADVEPFNARVKSRATAEPIPLDVFFKVFKENMENLEQLFEKQGRGFEEQDQRFENLDQPFQRGGETSVEMKEDL